MKKSIALIMFCIMAFTLTACSSKNVDVSMEKGDFTECQRGFIDSLGNSIVETPEGYYVLMGNYLTYMDESMETYTLLCSKPECLHNKEQLERVINCDAFFPTPKAISYYDGYLYLLADSLDKEEPGYSIYRTTLDGSSRKKIYKSGEDTQSFVIHRGDILVYEKKYDLKKEVPTVTITRFPADAPEKASVIFENSDYEDPEINSLICYGDYCYFELLEFTPYYIYNHGKRIDLDTGSVSDFCGFIEEGSFEIGGDRVFCAQVLEYNPDEVTWISEFYQSSLEGKEQKRLTEKDFPALQKEQIILSGADDQYLYLSDLYYGPHKGPAEKRKIYVYTYDGELAAEIPSGEFSEGYTIRPGNEKFLLIKDIEAESNETVYYRIDKSEFGNNPKPREVFRVTRDYKVGFSY